MMNFMIILLNIRSRTTWYEKGEKNNKYFLNLEKSNKKMSCIRKTFTSDETLTVNPKTILSELELFYSNLYKTKNDVRNQKGNCPLSWMTFQVSQGYLKSCVRYVRGKLRTMNVFLYCNHFRRIKLPEMMV